MKNIKILLIVAAISMAFNPAAFATGGKKMPPVASTSVDRSVIEIISSMFDFT